MPLQFVIALSAEPAVKAFSPLGGTNLVVGAKCVNSAAGHKRL